MLCAAVLCVLLCFVQGVSAPHIQDVRSMTKSICVSSLLANAPDAQRYIASGGEHLASHAADNSKTGAAASLGTVSWCVNPPWPRIVTRAHPNKHSLRPPCCTCTADMMTDATVGDILLEELLQPASAGMSTADLNCVVDGFPRTAVQVRALRLGDGQCFSVPASQQQQPMAGAVSNHHHH
jgi:hypothetical protein